jgi:methionyl aminopeptidase
MLWDGMTLEEEKLRSYLKAGEVNAKVLSLASSMVKASRRVGVLGLCERLEEEIRRLGGQPAFPCNIGVNDVAAHMSPIDDGNEYLPPEGLVKIDIGTRIGGYIADSAVTIPLSRNHEGIVKASIEVLEAAIEDMRSEVKTGEVGKVIEEEAKARGFKTIRNLSGHLISEYNLHAGKSIPNIHRKLTPKMEADEVYAVEPFLTYPEAMGEVVEGGRWMIFQVVKLKKPKDKSLTKLYTKLLDRTKRLPFSPRWFKDTAPLSEILRSMEALRRDGILYAYPVLIERSRGYVAQSEHTVIVTEDGPIVTTRG